MPIVREDSGLALSSRNERLTENQKKRAAIIYEQLKHAKTLFEKKISNEKIIDIVVSNINHESGMNVEYFEIVDGETLQIVDDTNAKGFVVACIAVLFGDVRLIDNIIFRQR